MDRRSPSATRLHDALERERKAVWPMTVHDLWLALTTAAPNLPLFTPDGSAVTGLDLRGPDGGVSLELGDPPQDDDREGYQPAWRYSAAHQDVLTMLRMFENITIDPQGGAVPPPPTPFTAATKRLVSSIRARLESVEDEGATDDDDEFHSSEWECENEIFDPFTTIWVPKTWHPKIELQPAPSESRVFGAEIRGGDCCIWRGWNNRQKDRNPEHAYGCVRVGGQKYLLHRYAFMMFYDVVLYTDDIVDHICRQPLCFNPMHHDCTTSIENYERGDGPLYRFQSMREKMREHVEEIPF
jgi:hypothetical protein